MADLGEAITDQIDKEDAPVEPKYLSDADEKSFYGKIKKKNKYYLIKLSDEERKRIAEYIVDKYNDALPKHQDLCNKIDEWDDVARLMRKEVIGSTGDLPNYRLPLSLVAHEVIHANIMNVFFSPKDILRCIPTAADDIPKVNNVSVFGNWSMKNELDLFMKCDQMFHASEKNGESVPMIYWKKEYGVEIKRNPMKDDFGNIIYDEDTKEPKFEEVEEPKLIYNAPFMEVLNRKDYIQPADAIMGQTPEWEGRLFRQSYDKFLKEELKGCYYAGSIDEIKSWPAKSLSEVPKTDTDGNDMEIGGWNKEFIEWYGGMRINVVEEELDDNEAVKAYELEDEFIAVVHIKTKTLCGIRKNRFPMKQRPFIIDYFIPDDSGRRAGVGIYELMDSLQKAYDVLFNQFVYATDLSNKPLIFFSPTGNMRDEKFKIQAGYAYPTTDPKSVQLFEFPQPNDSIKYAMQLLQQWAQLLFGISDYAAGLESTIDPEAPAKKAQIIVDQGNVRLNMIIKRKNDVLKEIFKRWFLLYRDNMPPNKFMRIAGEGESKDPWKFNPISYEDFALQSIPDFELTGNILNANKQLESNKAIAIYQMLITNIFFSPQTQQGLQALRSLTKWLIDKMDDAGLSRFLPEVQNDGIIYTPEEENARMMQGDNFDPLQNEDHVDHLKKHLAFLNDLGTPAEIKVVVGEHIKKTIEMMRQQMTQNMVMQGMGGAPTPPMNPMGGPGMPNGGANNVAPVGASGASGPVLPQ